MDNNMDQYKLETIKRDFDALVTTIQSVYDLRGIGVSAAYVSQQIMEYMLWQYHARETNFWNFSHQMFDESEVEFTKSARGNMSVSFKPFGADRIPIKVKYSGKNPWKIVVGYRND